MTISEILKSGALKDSLNESQITDIENAFNEAVDLKAAQVANDILAEKELELQESYEEKELELVEQFKEHTDNFEQKMLEKLDGFIEKVVDDFMYESRELLEAEQKAAKSTALLKIFDNLIETAGVDTSKLVEGAKLSANSDYNRICEKYDAAVAERQELKAELAELKNKVLISEATEGMTLAEAEKFKKIASLLLEGEEDEEEAEEKVKNLKKSVSKNSDSDDEDEETDEDDEDSEDSKDVGSKKTNESLRRKKIDWSMF